MRAPSKRQDQRSDADPNLLCGRAYHQLAEHDRPPCVASPDEERGCLLRKGEMPEIPKPKHSARLIHGFYVPFSASGRAPPAPGTISPPGGSQCTRRTRPVSNGSWPEMSLVNPTFRIRY